MHTAVLQLKTTLEGADNAFAPIIAYREKIMNAENEPATEPEMTLCQAATKAGSPCRNRALPGSVYCYAHRNMASVTLAPVEPTVEQTAPAKPATRQDPAPARQWDLLAAELNVLAQELQKRTPGFAPPPFAPDKPMALLRTNVASWLPEEQRELLAQLQRNLQDTSVNDLVDPETWKGAWYLVTYLLQEQAGTVKDQVAQRLAALPGADVVTQLKSNLEGTTAKDLLDLETWKGLWYVVSYTAQYQLQEAKRKITGEKSE
jgi:hypothetical protein